ncbi:MAG: hypothetical protein EXR75_09645 [Myxococcales bacterium]|nr:hypothetical protein [Myxococcales bacterium]
MNRFALRLAATAALGAAMFVFGCGTDDEVTLHPSLPVDDGSSGGSETIGGGGSAPGPEVCPDATSVIDVEPAQSNTLFLVDRSGSMHLRVTDTVTRWNLTKAGLFDLLDAMPASARGGLSLFPAGDAPIDCCVITTANTITCDGCLAGELPEPENRCDALEYQDLDVGVGPLDALQVEAMKAKIATVDEEFYWGTPLAPALAGAVDSMVAMKAPGVSSVVLLTDGLPTSCHTADDPTANDIQRVVDAAALGYGSAVRTYVMGVIDGVKASDATALSAIAEAGGTGRYAGCELTNDCAYQINVASFADDLAVALESIALDAMSCTIELPEVAGGVPDYDAVNITVTTNGVTITVLRDTSHGDGWDYLPGQQNVQLYGASCETLKADLDAQIKVVVGCQTVGG